MTVALCINTLFVGSILLISGFTGGLTYRILKSISDDYFDLFFIIILMACLVVFYLFFLLTMVIYYRSVLKVIEKKECSITMDADRGQWPKQCLRIIIDAFVVFLSLPIVWSFPGFLRVLGAKIGKNLNTKGKVFNADIVEIGENVVIGLGAVIIGHVVEGNAIIFKKVRIGKNVTIGVRSFIPPGVVIGDNTIIAAGAILPKNTIIPPNQVWGGVPARKIKDRNLQTR